MAAKTATKRRLWRYEVDEVWGFDDRPKPPVQVGDVLIDRWKTDRCWNVYDFSKGATHVGGWHAKLLGEYDGPVNAKGLPVSEGSPDAVGTRGSNGTS